MTNAVSYMSLEIRISLRYIVEVRRHCWLHKSSSKKLKLARNGVDKLGRTAEITIRLGLGAKRNLTYGPIPTMVFDPGATCVRPLNK